MNDRTKPIDLPKLDELSLDRILGFSTHTYWGVGDLERFGKLMDEAKTLVNPGYYLGDNIFTWSRNNSALEDSPFRKAWESNIRNPSDKAILWRRYILACAAYHAVHLPGDFVECGVYLGTGIKTVMDYLGGNRFPKQFWGYDTFDYNPIPGRNPAKDQEPGLYEKVKQRFSHYPQVTLIKGLLPDSFSEGMPESIAYLHIDLNHFEGEVAVLDALFDKVVPGGMVILDDYEWSGMYRPQKKAEDQWFDRREYRVFPLPTGQGFVIKR